MVCMNMERAFFQYEDGGFYAKMASSIEEALKLIGAGFEYVTAFNGMVLFRKCG